MSWLQFTIVYLLLTNLSMACHDLDDVMSQELVSLILQVLFKTLLVSGNIDLSDSQTELSDKELNLQ